MTYDPFQTSSVMGACAGATPFQLPYAGVPAMNPAAVFNPLATAYPGIAGVGGIVPQQLQLAQILAARAAISQLLGVTPWATGFNNPLLASAFVQNPLLATGLENPLLNPILAHSQFATQPHFVNPFLAQSVPQFSQIGSPYGQAPGMLAPQSWVGQPGLYGSQLPGQVHPLLSQLAGRGFYGAGIAPWAGF